jgi:hypothetical protein
LNPIKHLWRDLIELERSCIEEWKKLPKYRCAKLVASYPRKLDAVITAKGASTKYRLKGLNTYVTFQFFNSKNVPKSFCFVIMVIVCTLMRGKNL